MSKLSLVELHLQGWSARFLEGTLAVEVSEGVAKPDALQHGRVTFWSGDRLFTAPTSWKINWLKQCYPLRPARTANLAGCLYD